MTRESTHIPIDAETFLDKLACGFGRVVMFLRENDAAPYREAILDSCLHHRAFDTQTESYRTDYLCDIIQTTGESEFYAEQIRQALGTDNDDYWYDQLYELAGRLAQNGDDEARRVMYDRFARQAAQQDTTGAESFILLDGLDGYLFLAKQFQRHPLTEEDHWEEVWLLDQAETQAGKAETQQTLERAAQQRPEMAEYFVELEKKRTRWQAWREERKPRESPTYDDLKNWIADPTQTAHWQTWRSWSRRLDEETLRRLAQDLLAETDRVPLLKLLHVFRDKPFPLSIDRLLDLAKRLDEDLAEAARWALGNLTDPRIHALALELCEEGEALREAVHLLRNNFAPGDYARVERLVKLDMSSGDYHDLGIGVRQLIEANPLPEAIPALLTLYKRGRCTLCRSSVVDLLASLGPLPPWIMDEGRYDAEPLTRSAILAEENRDGTT